MPRNKQQIPRHGQQRKVVLSQNTTETEAGQLEKNGPDSTNTGASAKGLAESVGPVNRAMYGPSQPKLPWDKIGVVFSVTIVAIGFIWYLASQDSIVKNLADESKDLKKKTEETSRVMIESGVRLNNVERRITDIEQHERNIAWQSGKVTQTPPNRNKEFPR